MDIDGTAVQLVFDALWITLKISAPILVAGMAIGFIISILQAVTSIQDQTLTFVPKIVVMIVVAMLLLPWIVVRLVEFTADMFLLF